MGELLDKYNEEDKGRGWGELLELLQRRGQRKGLGELLEQITTKILESVPLTKGSGSRSDPYQNL